MTYSDDRSPFDAPLGQILRIPCKFIKGKTDAHPVLLKAIAQELKKQGKNILPVFVQQLRDEEYRAFSNIHVLEAARQAKSDFVWCIVVDETMRAQVQVELGQVVRVNILTASISEITQTIEYLQGQNPDLKKIIPLKVAEAIAEYRATKQPANLSFLTKMKCGIGKAKIPLLAQSLVLA